MYQVIKSTGRNRIHSELLGTLKDAKIELVRMLIAGRGSASVLIRDSVSSFFSKSYSKEEIRDIRKQSKKIPISRWADLV